MDDTSLSSRLYKCAAKAKDLGRLTLRDELLSIASFSGVSGLEKDNASLRKELEVERAGKAKLVEAGNDLVNISTKFADFNRKTFMYDTFRERISTMAKVLAINPGQAVREIEARAEKRMVRRIADRYCGEPWVTWIKSTFGHASSKQSTGEPGRE